MFSRKKREEQKARAKEKLLEQQEAELKQEELIKAEVSGDNKKIYLIAGAVAVLGAVIIIIKTRKK
jgi:hypothetical protein